MSTPDEMPSRRSMLEGVVVALATGVGGFAWFAAAGPAGENELDEREDEQEEQQEEQQEELDDEQDEDNSGHGSSHDDDDDS